MRPIHRSFVSLAACAAAASPAWAQATAAEVSRAGHVVRRVEFGASVGEVAALLPTSTSSQPAQISTYIVNQILQQNITESAEHTSLIGPLSTLYPPQLTDAAAGWATTGGVPQPGGWSIEQLAETNMIRALWSSYSLREKMTQFWQRHFNTNYWKLANYFEFTAGLSQAQARLYAAHFEAKQNDLFRTHCMGTFYDVLKASAEGEAMIIYLDSVDSGAPMANQNYGRELLELHTLGLRSWIPGPTGPVELPNYTFQDILDAADIFSGWSLVNNGGTFSFNFKVTGSGTGSHIATQGATRSLFDSPGAIPWVYIDPVTGLGAPMLIPHDLNLPTEGQTLLWNLSNSIVTAEHISRKLYRHFISPVDPPPFDPLILQCMNLWRTQPGGNLQAVLATLLTSGAFLDVPQNRWDLARTPLEALGQTVAVLDGQAFVAGNPSATLNRVQSFRFYLEEYLGQNLFQFPSPDGFPTGNDELLTSMRMLGTTRLKQELYGKFNHVTVQYPTTSIGWNYIPTMAPFVSVLDEVGLTNYWSQLWFAGDQPQSDWLEILKFFSTAETGSPPAARTLAQALGLGLTTFLDQFLQATAFAACHPFNSMK